MSGEFNAFEMAQQQFDAVAEKLQLDDGMRELLRWPRREYHFTVPVMNAAFAATVLRWAMLGLIVVGAAWGLRGAFGWMDGRAGTRGGGSTPAPTDPVGATTSGAAREGGAV